ncbi:MAG TPA: CBS domain-containing protein [Acidimicrobiales bacterium]|nr:CBS domain-containing protein [Acidimicrobiales bacterium]
MRDADVGPLIVIDDKGEVCGMVTDRDIVVRAMAEGPDPATTRVGEICSQDLTMVSPRASVDEALHVMRERATRRLPVLEGEQAVGIVSLGDLALEREPTTALSDISAAPPNK